MPRQSDILRAMKAAAKLGMTVRILPDGSIEIVPMPKDTAPQPETVAQTRKWAL